MSPNIRTLKNGVIELHNEVIFEAWLFLTAHFTANKPLIQGPNMKLIAERARFVLVISVV